MTSNKNSFLSVYVPTQLMTGVNSLINMLSPPLLHFYDNNLSAWNYAGNLRFLYIFSKNTKHGDSGRQHNFIA